MTVFGLNIIILILAIAQTSKSQSNQNQAEFGNEKDCSKIKCSYNFEPVCGSDGETYGNRCNLEVARCVTGIDSLQVDYEGACDNSK